MRLHFYDRVSIFLLRYKVEQGNAQSSLLLWFYAQALIRDCPAINDCGGAGDGSVEPSPPAQRTHAAANS